MEDEIKVTSKGYSITLTHVPTGREATCSLDHNLDKWIVRGDGYQGYFRDLEGAYKEACNHIKFKLRKGEKND